MRHERSFGPLLLMTLFACGDGIGYLTVGPGAADTTSGSTSADPDPTSTAAGDEGTSTGASTGTTQAAETTGSPACEPGDLGCVCLGEFCREGGYCWFGECAPASGECYELEFNWECDEGTQCPPGADPTDCCGTDKDGVCDEASGGGTCPKGSDIYDCGYCPWTEDRYCNEGTDCGPGTDVFDCCAGVQNGVCEEAGRGGACPDGSDFYDCGDCPYTGNGTCEESSVCPPGSDKPDCCAAVQDGVCEEEGQGGPCPVGSDFYDCGYCPTVNDTFCDEPGVCPPGSDPDDCCAHVNDEVCEEEGQGGACADGSDFYDCGECPEAFLTNLQCDEPGYCPPGSDPWDCCGTDNDGVCEEIGMGGACPDGSDFYDCGYCPYIDDGTCNEPFCPLGTDPGDCCAIPKNGVCDEMGMGGACAPGSDYYDCGFCPGVDNGECDEPFDCPPGSDEGDCA